LVFGLWRLAFLEAVEAKNALLYHAQAAGESGLTVLQARADSQSKATIPIAQSNACVHIHHDSQREACCGGHDQGRCSMKKNLRLLIRAQRAWHPNAPQRTLPSLLYAPTAPAVHYLPGVVCAGVGGGQGGGGGVVVKTESSDLCAGRSSS